MDGRQLNRLGRRLIALARQANTIPGDRIPSSGEAAVLGEVVESPGCSIRQLCERTGFVQSHVSAIVAELVGRGLLRTEADPADRRRTLVHPATPLTCGVDRRQSPIDETLATALGDSGKAEEAAALIDRLAALLLTDRKSAAPTPVTAPAKGS
ncbi:MarR family winged helix-turn-helix transcriptional regulator [Nocardia flavorosea]|uniref:MarR family transcriptional regulator n=1 Tax=Nocardia flavorosea TaxID=53429 RepID=A0A846YN69_9NOCA|nr:helix-turn-helix domain-containing protein [Nocardia flavorosea]NKY58359.1 MarR family transcriptional regulator [Nocardia flavorosea]